MAVSLFEYIRILAHLNSCLWQHFFSTSHCDAAIITLSSCSPHIRALKDVYNIIVNGDCRSIFYVDLLQSDTFLMSIETIVTHRRHITTCSRFGESVVSSAIMEENGLLSWSEAATLLVPTRSASRFASARWCSCWLS